MFTHERANWGVGGSENMGESSNTAGVPLVDIRLTDLPKSGEVGCPTYPSGSDVPGQTDTQLVLSKVVSCQLF